jgi:uncharacterized protein with HEPN domain
MQPRSAALLWDLLTAAQRIQGFVAARTWDDYASDVLLRSASSILVTRSPEKGL